MNLCSDSNALTPNPAPTPSEGPIIHDLVIADIEARKRKGIETYGMPLRTRNGRNHLKDAYEEVLDTAAYLRAAQEEIHVLALDYVRDNMHGLINLCAREIATDIVAEERRKIEHGLIDGERRAVMRYLHDQGVSPGITEALALGRHTGHTPDAPRDDESAAPAMAGGGLAAAADTLKSPPTLGLFGPDGVFPSVYRGPVSGFDSTRMFRNDL